MGKRYILSERDSNRIQEMLRWYDLNKNFGQHHRRRGIVGAGVKTSSLLGVRWFKLTAVAADPMTGHKQAFDEDAKTWGDAEAEPEDIDVYCYPDSDVDHYPANSLVPCAKDGGEWHALIPDSIILDICEGE